VKRPTRLQVSRRTVQVAVLLLTVATPVIARYANYLSARQLDKAIERFEGSPQGLALHATDALLLGATGLDRDEEEGSDLRHAERDELLVAARQVRGSVWSFELFGLTLTDPLAAAESVLASRSFRWVMIVGVLVPIVGTILLGRFFCSWLCPAGFLFEITGSLRRLLRFLEVSPGRARLWHGNKYVLLGLGLAVSFVIGLPVLGYVYPPALIGREAHNGITMMFDRAEDGLLGFSAAGLTIASWFLLAIALVEVVFGPRLWCRSLCPGGALYALLGRYRLVRIERSPDNCTTCGECVLSCAMGLSPMTDKTGMECDNCGACVAACGDDALGFRLLDLRSPRKEARA
jgi:polyferredoxin